MKSYRFGDGAPQHLHLAMSIRGLGLIVLNLALLNCGVPAAVSSTTDKGQSQDASPRTDASGTDASGTDASGTDTSSTDIEPSLFSVIVEVEGGGSVTPDGTIEVAAGQRLRLSLAPQQNHELDSVSGCSGSLQGTVYETAPIQSDCLVRAVFTETTQDTVTVTITASGDGRVAPTGAQRVPTGQPFVVALQPRITSCTVSLSGSCVATHNAATNEITLPGPSADCSLQVTFDCGNSHLELRPENVGVFWENRSQQFSAIQVFANTGERVDVTTLFEWSSSNGSVVSLSASGLATALVDHGTVTVTVNDPTASQPLTQETSLTVVRVVEWRKQASVETWDTGQVYLDNVRFSRSDPNSQATTVMYWDWSPRPWTPHDNTISGLIWAIWSENGGNTYIACAWDYISNASTGKGIGGGMPSEKMGTMLSSICLSNPCYEPSCDPGRYCNGTDRTNLVFTNYPFTPNPSSNCL